MASKKRHFVGHITGSHPDANGFNADYDAETYDTLDGTDTPVYTLQAQTPVRDHDPAVPVAQGARCFIVVWPETTPGGTIDRFDLIVPGELPHCG